MEIKTIPIAPDYTISESGVITSYKYKTPKVLKQTPDGKGYKCVALRSDGKYLNKRVHQLVAITFLENPLNLPQVNHKDANKSNNHRSNLEWCTSKENIKHAFDLDLVGRKKGVESHMYNKGRKVICNGILYNSVADCARNINRPRPSLSGELRGDRENKSGIRYAD